MENKPGAAKLECDGCKDRKVGKGDFCRLMMGPNACGGLPRSETVSDQWRRTLSDIDAALAVRRRSAHLDVLMEDGTRVYFNLHDPHWRVALYAFRHEVERIIDREIAHER
jgi:hypothetical protein